MKANSGKPRQNFQVRNYDQKKTFKKKRIQAIQGDICENIEEKNEPTTSKNSV